MAAPQTKPKDGERMAMIKDLETRSAMPLYKQLKERIQEQITSGAFPAGERIPSEQKLMELFHVSRITVRTAIEELVNEDVLIRQRGKGTYVGGSHLQAGGSMRGARSFFETCRLNGKTPGSTLLRAGFEPVPERVARYLQINSGDKCVYIEILRKADDLPIALDYTWYHPRFVYLLAEDLESEIYGILRKREGIHPRTEMGYLDIGLATAAEAGMLDVPKGEPLLLLHTNVVDDRGQPVHYGKMVTVSRRYRFYI